MSYAKQAVTRLTLDMGLPDIQKSVSLTAGDTNRRLEVTLIDKGSPFALPPTWTAVLAGVLPSGDELYESCVVDNGRIVFDFVAANAVSSEEGVFEVAFDVFDEGGELVASPKIGMHVTPSMRRLKDPLVSERLTALQEFVGAIGSVRAEIDALVGLMTSTGTFTIYASDWEDSLPAQANVAITGVENGSVVLLLPADENTRMVASNAKLSAYPIMYVPVGGQSSVEIFRAEAEAIPEEDMTFAYVVIKTKATNRNPLAAIVGVDAYGGGGGGGDSTGGVDQEAVEAIVKSIVPQWARNYSKPSYNASEVGADPEGTADGKVSKHNTSGTAHNDIRTLINGLGSSKVSVTDIVNNLTSTATNKPLSAAQGKALKGLIDSIDVSGGIHVGSDAPPTGATVWIDPAGTAYALYNGEVETV